MLCNRLNINLADGYVIFRSEPRIVAWATAAHSFPWDTACLLSGVPDYFYRNKISSGGDLSHYSSASLY